MPQDLPQKPSAEHGGAHWLTNGQAFTTVFVLVSTVCLYPSNMALGSDGNFAITVRHPRSPRPTMGFQINLDSSSSTTSTYTWSDDLAQLPDVVAVKDSFGTFDIGLDHHSTALSLYSPRE